jgi:hypothetical protein
MKIYWSDGGEERFERTPSFFSLEDMEDLVQGWRRYMHVKINNGGAK